MYKRNVMLRHETLKKKTEDKLACYAVFHLFLFIARNRNKEEQR